MSSKQVATSKQLPTIDRPSASKVTTISRPPDNSKQSSTDKQMNTNNQPAEARIAMPEVHQGRNFQHAPRASATSAVGAQVAQSRVHDLFAQMDEQLTYSPRYSLVEVFDESERQSEEDGMNRKKRRREASPWPVVPDPASINPNTSTTAPVNTPVSMPAPAKAHAPAPPAAAAVPTLAPTPSRIPIVVAAQAHQGPVGTTSKSTTIATTSTTSTTHITAISTSSSSKPPTAALVAKEVPVQPVCPQVDPDKHIAKRLKAQKIAERRQARALEQAGLGGQAIVDREEREKRVREEVDAVYKRGLGKATGLEVEVSRSSPDMFPRTLQRAEHLGSLVQVQLDDQEVDISDARSLDQFRVGIRARRARRYDRGHPRVHVYSS
jgi:hypothetical protein